MNYDNYLSTHFGRIADTSASMHRLNSLRANYPRLLPADRDAAILEIGPGRGEFLELAGELGYRRVTAIDLSAEVVELLSQRYPDVARVSDTVSFLAEKSTCFDVIIMMHVLEHVPKTETVALLAAIRQALSPGGSLVIEVPNMANPVVGLTVRYADFTHETGFTRSSLEQVLRMAMFESVTIRPFAIPGGSLPRWVQRCARALIEGVIVVIGLFYYGRREIVSANIIAVARAAAAPRSS
jgi:2-polyprenyl-3-methyl-5-hydroxy-6-metoxy-1,4-benzoquinol methylase